MHLVIGIDDSPCSTAALETVRRMTWPASTTATVVCSLPPFVAVVPEAYMALADALEPVRRDQRATNHELASRAAASLAAVGIQAKPCAPDGDPRLTLIDIAVSEHADLLVVGSHGRSALGRLFLGSVANHVVNHAPCNVLVVRRAAGGA